MKSFAHRYCIFNMEYKPLPGSFAAMLQFREAASCIAALQWVLLDSAGSGCWGCRPSLLAFPPPAARLTFFGFFIVSVPPVFFIIPLFFFLFLFVFTPFWKKTHTSSICRWQNIYFTCIWLQYPVCNHRSQPNQPVMFKHSHCVCALRLNAAIQFIALFRLHTQLCSSSLGQT